MAPRMVDSGASFFAEGGLAFRFNLVDNEISHVSNSNRRGFFITASLIFQQAVFKSPVAHDNPVWHLTSTLRHQIWFFRFKACTHYGISQSIQNESSNNGSISLCVGVRNIVLEITVDEFSNLTWIVVTVFAASNTLSTLISMPASLIRLSSSL